jgi:glycosyltransferase involved in cell wall biosynthesis
MMLARNSAAIHLCRPVENGSMRVAVIIPCFNVAPYVERAIRSVWGQTHSDIDLIIVDDGSTDDTCAVVERLMHTADQPVPIRLIKGGHRGASAARNVGVAATDAQWIQFLDADDELLPGKIKEQLGSTAAHGGAAVIVGGYRNRWEDGAMDEVLPGDGPWMALIHGKAGTTSANLWERSALLQAGGWDERLASSQDHELLFRILQQKAVCVIDRKVRAIILKRARSSISKVDPVGNWERYITLRAAIRDHLRTTRPVGYEEAIKEADRHIFGAIRIIARSDRDKALELRGRSLPQGYAPTPGAGISRIYAAVHGLFGFQVAEAIAGALGILHRSNNR